MTEKPNPVPWLIPDQNWSKLPHQFIKLLPKIKTLAELKVLIYILRHTWGYNDRSKVISQDEFINGRKYKNGTRIDDGTGLARNSVKAGIKNALEHGYIVQVVDETDGARIEMTYTLSFLGVSNTDTSPEIDSVKGSNLDPDGGQILTLSDGVKGSNLDPRTKKEKKSKKETKKETTADGKRGAVSKQKINATASVMIKSWLKATGAVVPDAQAIYNSHAVGLVKVGVKVADIFDFIAHLKKDNFWKNKTPKFDYIASNIKSWLDDRNNGNPKPFGEQHRPDDMNGITNDELIQTGKAQLRMLFNPSSEQTWAMFLQSMIDKKIELSAPAQILMTETLAKDD